MSRFAFCGGTYTAVSPNIDAEECINRYPEVVEGQGRSAMALIPVEGLSLFASLPAGSGQSVPGIFNFNGRAFTCGIVLATQQMHLYEVNPNATLTDRGALGAPLTNAPAIWAANPNQIAFTVAGTGQIYVFILKTNTIVIASYTSNGVPTGQQVSGAAAVGYIDGFFVAFQQNSNRFGVSNLEDGTLWDFINISQVSEFADNIVSMQLNQRTVLFLGRKASVPYYDAGGLFPLIPIPGAYIEEGSAAAFGSITIDNTICWIGGNDDEGNCMAWRLNGYTPQRISTHAVESAWQKYATIADAISFKWRRRGHRFWGIYFPTANATWVYDFSTQLWHKQGLWNPATNSYGARNMQCATFAFGRTLVGDWASGNIYSLNEANTTDNGKPIRRLRRAPYIAKEHQWIHFGSLEILCETGLPSQIVGPSENPVILNLSDELDQVWQVEIADNSVILPSFAPAGTIASSPIIADNVDQSTFWKIAITSGGGLYGVRSAYGRKDLAQLLMSTNGTFLDSGLQMSQQGVISVLAPQPHYRAPKIDMRWSDDNAHTFGNFRSESLGLTGEYAKRVRWMRLGKSRGRAFEVVDSDPVNVVFVDAFVEASPDHKPQERLGDQLRKMA